MLESIKNHIQQANYGEKKRSVTVNMVAHNAFRADYPLIEKVLLECDLLTRSRQVETGMCKILHAYKINDTEDYDGHRITIVFTDSLNLFKGSLDQFGKATNCDVMK